MNLTTALIVRNEADYLEACLDSIQAVSDQIVIVDTGSTDATLDIARQYGAEIYHFDWVDDFAAARNESLKFAKGTWILCIDADERLEKTSVDELKTIVHSNDNTSYFRVNIRNQTREKDHYNITSTHRLFPNFQGIEFRGRIHEQIMASANEKGLHEKNSTITLKHLGYINSNDPNSEKSRRNYNLLKKGVKEHPNNAYLHFTFAQHLDLTGKTDQALHHYTTALELNQFAPPEKATLLNALANNLIKLKKFKEARLYCYQSIALVKQQVAAYYQLYKIGMISADTSIAIDGLQKLIDTGFLKNNFKTNLVSDLQLQPRTLLYTLGNLLKNSSRLPEALECYINLPDSYILDEQNYRQAINIALKLENLSLAGRYLEDLQKKCGLPLADLKILAIVYLKKKKYTEAINVYRKIIDQEPDNQEATRRLAALYAVTGQSDNAARLTTQS